MLLTAIFLRAIASYDSYKLKNAKFAEIQKEIEVENRPAVLEILKAVTFDRERNAKILKASILQDNVEIFNDVLETLYQGNVNKMLSQNFDTGPGGPSSRSTRTILAYSIKNDCPAIALRLANDEKTDITKIGQTTFVGYDSSIGADNVKTTIFDDSALQMARAASMPDVAATLSLRTADLKREEARKLEAEAAKLRMG
jgi:hypothetical protein